jgi:hypothetical protein
MIDESSTLILHTTCEIENPRIKMEITDENKWISEFYEFTHSPENSYSYITLDKQENILLSMVGLQMINKPQTSALITNNHIKNENALTIYIKYECIKDRESLYM